MNESMCVDLKESIESLSMISVVTNKAQSCQVDLDLMGSIYGELWSRRLSQIKVVI